MTILQDEITNDPEGIGYAQYLPDAPGKVVELLNDPRFDQLGTITMEELEGFMKTNMHSSGLPIYWAMKQTVRSSEAPENIRLLCEMALDLTTSSFRIVKMYLPVIQTNLDALVATGFLTVDQRIELEAMATHKVSRAQQLGLDKLTDIDIMEAIA